MEIEDIFKEIEVFSSTKHGSSNYDKDELFVKGNNNEYAPLSYLEKKVGDINGERCFLEKGFIYESFDFLNDNSFHKWFESQFSKKLTRRASKQISLIHLPNNKSIFDAIEKVHECYEILRRQQILWNGKKLPVQLGEWYAKSIFGLRQVKSTSQRGFDFYIDDRRVEVKVNWGDEFSPKGVKIRKSLVELSDYCIVMYVARNFMIREICFLDSEFVLRKFGGKGHTIFLKNPDISNYYFSNSKVKDRTVVNRTALLKYALPTLAMKLAERFQ